MEKIFLPLHLLTLLYIAWTIYHADHMGYEWIRGNVLTIDKKKAQVYHRHTWIALGFMIITGFLVFFPEREYFLTRWQFFVKMAFVVTLICNGFVINYLMKTATKHAFKDLTLSQKIPLLISGAVSTIAWLGATVMAFFIN